MKKVNINRRKVKRAAIKIIEAVIEAIAIIGIVAFMVLVFLAPHLQMNIYYGLLFICICCLILPVLYICVYAEVVDFKKGDKNND